MFPDDFFAASCGLVKLRIDMTGYRTSPPPSHWFDRLGDYVAALPEPQRSRYDGWKSSRKNKHGQLTKNATNLAAV
jgi:hypothetical protein